MRESNSPAPRPPGPAVVYVADAYCGWCWGFAERIAEFEAANRHRVGFIAISGGLFTGGRAGPLSAYPHIPGANARIAGLTGACFGEAYQRLVRDGTMVMDSADAAAGLAALRKQAPDRAIHWVHRLQEAFYVQGRSLSDPDTVAAIAGADGLGADEIRRRLADGTAAAAARADFGRARALGVSSYPTLLFVDENRVEPMPATGAALLALDTRLDQLLATRAAGGAAP